MDTQNSTTEKAAQTSTWLRSVLTYPWRWLAGLIASLVALAALLMGKRRADLAELDKTVAGIADRQAEIAALETKKTDLVVKLTEEVARATGIEKEVHALPEDEVTARLRARGYIK